MIYGNFLADGLDALGRADGGHARDRLHEPDDRPARPQIRPAAPLLGHDRRLQAGRRPGRLRIDPDHVGGFPERRQLHHALCRLERGRARGDFAKFVLDCEQIEMFYQLGQGPQFGDFEAALAAVREIGPGGHYLGTAHTREHFQTAFFMPELLDNNSFEQWELDGSKDANTRGLEAARHLLDNYEAPPSTRRSTRPSWPSSANARRCSPTSSSGAGPRGSGSSCCNAA